ncbi:hypothetical protein [Achromobacter sp.]|uniref:hypothetical protein n=1 Tax=Achromobacter sp. TaxID=134375 RepID=UPI003C736C9B
MTLIQYIRCGVAALRQRPSRTWMRWHGQRCIERLGRGGLLALAATLVLSVHLAVVQWPEKEELQVQAVELIARLLACHPGDASPGSPDLDQMRTQMRVDPDQRKQAVMDQLVQAGLLLVDIRYQGDDIIQDRLRRTSVDITAVGSYQDLSAGLRLLAAQPLLRLESLELDRQKPEDMLVNVKMRLSMLGET